MWRSRAFDSAERSECVESAGEAIILARFGDAQFGTRADEDEDGDQDQAERARRGEPDQQQHDGEAARHPDRDPRGGNAPAGLENADVVGPICESGDFLALERPLPDVAPGDLLCVFSAGAYGFSMSSNYNTRPRAAEILVTGEDARVVRRRETLEDLLGPEA